MMLETGCYLGPVGSLWSVFRLEAEKVILLVSIFIVAPLNVLFLNFKPQILLFFSFLF